MSKTLESNKTIVSVICPLYNEEKFIDGCVQSLLNQDYPQEELEILFVDGMSSDRTRTILARYVEQYSQVRLLDNPHRTVPYALNIGIRNTSGSVVIRVDAHCTYPKNYISRLVAELKRLNADNVGGVWNTMPANDSAECMAIAIGSSHRFGVGGSAHKVGASTVEQVDTVPFGCYKREVFDRIGLFDEELTRNQDDEFNARLINNGGSIYIIPDVVIDYTARDSMAKMRKMYFQYGLFKPLVNKKLGSPATIRQFFPMLFVVGLVLGTILSFLSLWLFMTYAAILILYAALGLSVGISSMRKYKKPSLLWLMPYTFLNIHISYGTGYLKGIYNILSHRDFNAKSNR